MACGMVCGMARKPDLPCERQRLRQDIDGERDHVGKFPNQAHSSPLASMIRPIAEKKQMDFAKKSSPVLVGRGCAFGLRLRRRLRLTIVFILPRRP